MKKPAVCLECMLYEGCNSYKIPARVGGGFNDKGPVDVMFVGEAPGREEDEHGAPFVGPAGAFLQEYLDHLEGTSYVLTNMVKCRPEDNRKPTDIEIELCRTFLEAEIAEAQPKIIVALGAKALKALYPEGSMSIAKARMAPIQFENHTLLATYHPSNHVQRYQRKDLTEEYIRTFDFIARILNDDFETEEPDIRIVSDETAYVRALKQFHKAKTLFLDVETKVHPRNPRMQTIWLPDAELICTGIGTSTDEPVWVIPVSFHDDRLKAALKGKCIVGHNVKYDVNALQHFWWHDIWQHVTIEDTMLMHSSLDQGKAGNGLKELASKFFGCTDWSKAVWDEVEAEEQRRKAHNKEEKRLARKEKREPVLVSDCVTFADIPFSLLADYNGRDVFWTIKLFHHLKKHEDVPSIYERLLIPASVMLGELEVTGLGASAQRHSQILNHTIHKIDQTEARMVQVREIRQVMAHRGTEIFNPNSPLDLEQLLAETEMEVMEYTETGRPKLNKEILGLLSAPDEDGVMSRAAKIWGMILNVRNMKNMISKFLGPLEGFISEDNRIHPTYKIAKVDPTGYMAGAEQSGGTDTGRLSLADPALMNLKHDALLRSMFIPRAGHLMAEFDYKQIEVRQQAVLAECRKLIALFESGVDCYRLTAMELYGYKTLDAVPKKVRQLCKVGVLAKIYREDVRSFAARNKIPLHEAEEFYFRFDAKYYEILDWQREVIKAARRGELLKTVWGRQMSFQYTEDKKNNEHIDRKACNALVQSPSSDNTVSKAIEGVALWRKTKKPVFHLNQLVHDSHWAEVLNSQRYTHRILERHQKMMEDRSTLPYKMTVPIEVEVKIGPHLGAMKEYDVKKQLVTLDPDTKETMPLEDYLSELAAA